MRPTQSPSIALLPRCRGSRPLPSASNVWPPRTCPKRAASLASSLEIVGTRNGPGFAPELRAACDMQGFPGYKIRGRAAEIGAGLCNLPGLTRAHHRVGARVGLALLRLVDAPARRFDRARRNAVDPDFQRRPFDGQVFAQRDDAGARRNRMGDAVEPLLRHHDDVDDGARARLIAPAPGGRL